MKKKKIDYVGIALFELAKQNYKKVDEFVKALYEHYQVSEEEESNVDLWSPVMDDDSFEKMDKFVKELIKQERKR